MPSSFKPAVLNLDALKRLYPSLKVWNAFQTACGACCDIRVATEGSVLRQMAEGVHGVRPVAGELAVWRAAAALAGLPFNSWVRMALNARAELDAALGRQATVEGNQGARSEPRPMGEPFPFRGPDPRRK